MLLDLIKNKIKDERYRKTRHYNSYFINNCKFEFVLIYVLI